MVGVTIVNQIRLSGETLVQQGAAGFMLQPPAVTSTDTLKAKFDELAHIARIRRKKEEEEIANAQAAVNQREAERIMQQQYDTEQQRLEAAHQQRLHATAAQPARTSHLQPPIITNTPAQTPPQGFTFDNFVDPNRLAALTQSIRIPQASAGNSLNLFSGASSAPSAPPGYMTPEQVNALFRGHALNPFNAPHANNLHCTHGGSALIKVSPWLIKSKTLSTRRCFGFMPGLSSRFQVT